MSSAGEPILDGDRQCGTHEGELSDLQVVAASKLLLEDCISAREDLGVITARRLRTACGAPGEPEDGAAIASAAREFALKMAELSSVAPALSQALVRLTEVYISMHPSHLRFALKDFLCTTLDVPKSGEIHCLVEVESRAPRRRWCRASRRARARS